MCEIIYPWMIYMDDPMRDHPGRWSQQNGLSMFSLRWSMIDHLAQIISHGSLKDIIQAQTISHISSHKDDSMNDSHQFATKLCNMQIWVQKRSGGRHLRMFVFLLFNGFDSKCKQTFIVSKYPESELKRKNKNQN